MGNPHTEILKFKLLHSGEDARRQMAAMECRNDFSHTLLSEAFLAMPSACGHKQAVTSRRVPNLAAV